MSGCYLSAMPPHVIATTSCGETKVMVVKRGSSAFVSPAWSVFAPTSELPYSKLTQLHDLAIDQNGVELWFEFRSLSQSLTDLFVLVVVVSFRISNSTE